MFYILLFLKYRNISIRAKRTERIRDFLEVNNYRQLTTIISIGGLSRYRDIEDTEIPRYRRLYKSEIIKNREKKGRKTEESRAFEAASCR